MVPNETQDSSTPKVIAGGQAHFGHGGFAEFAVLDLMGAKIIELHDKGMDGTSVTNGIEQLARTVWTKVQEQGIDLGEPGKVIWFATDTYGERCRVDFNVVSQILSVTKAGHRLPASTPTFSKPEWTYISGATKKFDGEEIREGSEEHLANRVAAEQADKKELES